MSYFTSLRFQQSESETILASLFEWNARPETLASQTLGDAFLERGEGVVLALPSVVPKELRYDPLYMNYLVNPQHPDFGTALSVSDIRPLDWDPRLV